jgi:hypothetical protein
MKNKNVVEYFFDLIKTEQVIKRNSNSYNGNVWVHDDNKRLMNYGTCLAQYDKETNTLFINETKYSSTTSRIQSMIKRELYSEEQPFNIQFLSHINIYTNNLITLAGVFQN